MKTNPSFLKQVKKEYGVKAARKVHKSSLPPVESLAVEIHGNSVSKEVVLPLGNPTPLPIHCE